MKKTLLILGIIIVVLLAGYSSIQAASHYKFKSLQNQCSKDVANANSNLNVYFAPGADQTKIQTIANDISSQTGVSSVSVQSPDHRLQAFVNEKTSSGDQTSLDAVKESPTNPFVSEIQFQLSSNQDISKTISYVTGDAQKYGVTIANTDTLKPGAGTPSNQEYLTAVARAPHNSTSVKNLNVCVTNTNQFLTDKTYYDGLL